MNPICRFLTAARRTGVPALRRPGGRRPVFLLALAAVTLAQAGCQSGFGGGCKSCNGLQGLRNLTERVFHPFRGAGAASAGGAGCCGGELGTESATPYGQAPVMTSPMPEGGVMAPPSTDSLPSGLSPIPDRTPSAAPGPAPGANDQGAKSPTGRATYEAFRPRYRKRSLADGSFALPVAPNPVPTTRSAQGLSTSRPPDVRTVPADPNPLDNLPPLELPRDLTSTSANSIRESPIARVDRVKPVAEPTPEPSAPMPGEISLAPGIRRFSGVDSKLAGGSLPTPAGLDWLAEKGYRTILDLRPDTDISAAFIAEVARRNMRYIALPMTLKTFDVEHVNRFRFETSLADARPLYFCDAQGDRAGALWYIQRRTADNVDDQVARRDAEALGLTDPKFWGAAEAYLELLKPAASPTLPPDPPAPTPAVHGPGDVEGLPNPAAMRSSVNPPPPTTFTPQTATTVSLKVPGDPGAWKTLAAMVVTTLGVPLAYFSRSAFPLNLRSLARASLAGPARSTRSLPHESDV